MFKWSFVFFGLNPLQVPQDVIMLTWILLHLAKIQNILKVTLLFNFLVKEKRDL